MTTAYEIKPHMSYSQYSAFVGTLGVPGCEACSVAKIKGEWIEEPTTAMRVGKYVDCHFSGSLDVYIAQNPDMFTRSGQLKAEYKKAQDVISRIERDEYFMTVMSGQKQVEMQAELFGVTWKAIIDSYHPGRAIVDLKVVRSITETHWVKDYGRMNFIEYWGYDLQGALYQEIVRINTGKRLPFLIAAATKEIQPNIEVIGFDQGRLDDVLKTIETHIPRILQVKRGEVEPDRCGQCDYCRWSKKLTHAIHYSELQES
jgi:hypothetical protein